MSELSLANFGHCSSRRALARPRLVMRFSLGPSSIAITLSRISVKTNLVYGFNAFSKLYCKSSKAALLNLSEIGLSLPGFSSTTFSPA